MVRPHLNNLILEEISLTAGMRIPGTTQMVQSFLGSGLGRWFRRERENGSKSNSGSQSGVPRAQTWHRLETYEKCTFKGLASMFTQTAKWSGSTEMVEKPCSAAQCDRMMIGRAQSPNDDWQSWGCLFMSSQAAWTGINYFTFLSLSSSPWQTRSCRGYRN